MKTFNLFCLLFALTVLSACSAQKEAKEITANSVKYDLENGENQTTNSADVKVQEGNAALTLADYIKRLPGVSVSGSGDNTRILIRGGAQSILGENSPLFVLDNTRLGRSYATAAGMIDINDIKNVRVLRDSEATARYGTEAAAGVIVIKSKKD